MTTDTRFHRLLPGLIRVGVTAAMVAITAFAVHWAWQQSVAHPWTRDGQVMAQVVQVAPRVAGPVLAVQVTDNQLVHVGDPLFTLDPTLFELALKQAEADLALAQAQAVDAEGEARRAADLLRRRGLAQQDYDLKLSVKASKAAAAQAAQVQVETARIRLGFTRVTAPVNGYVTNLRLNQGTFAAIGEPLVALVDADSFWIAAYFKETDLPHIELGDPAAVVLLGQPERPLAGRVAGIAFGIAERNQALSPGSLAAVNPTFEWIRLAQRIPVRIELSTPPGVPLRVGLSASVSVNPSRPLPSAAAAH